MLPISTSDLVGLAIFFVLILVAIIFFLSRMGVYRDWEISISRDEEKFEEEVKQSLGLSEAQSSAQVREPARPSPAALTPEEQVPPQPSALPGKETSGDKSNSLEELSKKLSTLNIIAEFEGKVPLPIPPAGLIYKLRQGGTCALLPRQESQEVMTHLARRFDMLFVLSSGNEVLVVERLQTKLPEMLDSPTDFMKQ